MCGVGLVADLEGRPEHGIVTDALGVLRRLHHRGGVGADPTTGDGCGILLQIPHALFARDLSLPEPGAYAVGTLFLRSDGARARIEARVEAAGLEVLGWREVPVDPSACGPSALETRPEVAQLFFAGADETLLPARRAVESLDGVYVASWSRRTVVYKGLLLPERLEAFYPDLADPDCASAAAVVHQRFSTNTLPSWERAHPYRLLAHNGEINTLRANVSRMAARSAGLDPALRPLLDPAASDSATLDDALALLVHGGRDLAHAVAMAIPPAWEGDPEMAPEVRAFHAWHGAALEPWDGPALVAFTDGRVAGATLDRNGLRPARYAVTEDRLVLASEAGVLDLDPAAIVRRGRLAPGEMLLVDLEVGGLRLDAAIKRGLATARPYGAWLAAEERPFAVLPSASAPERPAGEDLRDLLRQHGYSREDLEMLLWPMARTGKEPTGAMGDDTPLAVLSERPQPVFHYFKQRFAQVTNPPIDPLREAVVMSLRTLVGPERGLLETGPDRRRQAVVLPGPMLDDGDLERLRGFFVGREATVSMEMPGGLEAALDAVERRAEAAVRAGAELLVLSDRGVAGVALPSLLALGAVQRRLVEAGLRAGVGLAVESAEPREVMHHCLLVGFGATAVAPYGALAAIAEHAIEVGQSPKAAVGAYLGAVTTGFRKVLSKLGISTLDGYRGAQAFEALGLEAEVVERCFPGVPARLAARGFEALEAETRRRALPPRGLQVLDGGGVYRWRRDGEHHAYDPHTVGRLQHAVRSGRYELFKKFSRHTDGRSRSLRAQLDLVAGTPVPIEEVESVESIVARFRTGAMSYGSLSAEAHETLAVAMNEVGGRSNSGEGGEAAARRGTNRRSAIKQVASGRFGVTVDYLTDADELQIKMAQGAKPGEGGQLPGHKVDAEIAETRCATPGVTLISPPPHHDIYSIEDLAQLVHDLRAVNDTADISVKLVSEAGVGTIATGVAKTGADRILLSGHSGGTGAAPLSSIRHAGVPWELGVAEAQRSLTAAGLRGRVRLEVDGQLKTGRDVVVAGLLGAESFGFGTAALVASGCVLMRACHLNTCPVGIATQDPRLRARFPGEPDHVVNFMVFVAREVREWMAQLGFRRFDELVGRTDRLAPREDAEVDLACLLGSGAGGFVEGARPDGSPARSSGGPVQNTDRAVCTTLSGAIAKGDASLPGQPLRFDGSAGQSFGAFLAPGLDVVLFGEANESFGKGMSGGRLVVRPPEAATFCAADNTILGNVALYGATGGEAFVRGGAGERFAVRNSGAVAVVERVGDHGCEYMTRGCVVVLGPTGRNFAAGMSGGVAYVLDEDGRFAVRCNRDGVELAPLDREDEARVKALVLAHYHATESNRAWRVLSDWRTARTRFVRVSPHPVPVPTQVRPSEDHASAG